MIRTKFLIRTSNFYYVPTNGSNFDHLPLLNHVLQPFFGSSQASLGLQSHAQLFAAGARPGGWEVGSRSAGPLEELAADGEDGGFLAQRERWSKESGQRKDGIRDGWFFRELWGTMDWYLKNVMIHMMLVMEITVVIVHIVWFVVSRCF